MLDKDPFEMEDEEYEAELDEESLRSSESDGRFLNFFLFQFSICFLYGIVETDNTFSLDPTLLLSDKGNYQFISKIRKYLFLSY
jgi:hypothetical protein